METSQKPSGWKLRYVAPIVLGLVVVCFLLLVATPGVAASWAASMNSWAASIRAADSYSAGEAMGVAIENIFKLAFFVSLAWGIFALTRRAFRRPRTAPRQGPSR